VKRVMSTMLMIGLACTMSAFAQTDMSNDSTKKSDKMMGKKTSMTGCIAEKDGKYMMMNKEHPDGVQLMSSEDLKPHVGHKVHVKGMMMHNMSGDSMKSDDAMKKDNTMSKDDNMKHDGMGMMAMKVTEMKMESEHCDMPKMMDDKMKK
jgi:hypothetical protein